MKTRYLVVFVPLMIVTVALGQAAPAVGSPVASDKNHAADKASAYFHYCLGHIYEDWATLYGRAEYGDRAIEEYRLAIEDDPSSDYLNSSLAELYAKTGRIRDAVLEAQDIIRRDPSNVEARRLLGRIYLRSLGDLQAGAQSSEVLGRAIEQYEAIIKLDPKSVDDHLLLGRLYRLNNQSEKAENEFKVALGLQPFSEEAATTLAYLYNEQGDPAHAAQVLDGIPDGDRSSLLYSALGYTYEQQKDYKRAIGAYRKSVDLDPTISTRRAG